MAVFLSHSAYFSDTSVTTLFRETFFVGFISKDLLRVRSNFPLHLVCNMSLYQLVILTLSTLLVSEAGENIAERGRIFLSGLTSIVWDPSVPVDEAIDTLQPDCASIIREIHFNLSQGRTDAYKLLDFSSKGLMGALEGDFIALGEYDPCLKRGHSYCSISLLAHSNIQTRSLTDLTIHLEFHLCLPSSCSSENLVKFIETRVAHHPVTVASTNNNENAIVCDTQQNNSLDSRVARLSNHQIISLVFISSLIILLIISYFTDLINIDSGLIYLSLRRSMATIFSHDESLDGTTLPLDIVKVTVHSCIL